MRRDVSGMLTQNSLESLKLVSKQSTPAHKLSKQPQVSPTATLFHTFHASFFLGWDVVLASFEGLGDDSVFPAQCYTEVGCDCVFSLSGKSHTSRRPGAAGEDQHSILPQLLCTQHTVHLAHDGKGSLASSHSLCKPSKELLAPFHSPLLCASTLSSLIQECAGLSIMVIPLSLESAAKAVTEMGLGRYQRVTTSQLFWC